MNPGLHYREVAVAGASPVRLVILLYEQAVEDLRRASSAQRAGDIERRTREINHALLVLGHLQRTLDTEQGGKVAADLERFYTQVRNGLMEAQFQQSAEAIERQIACLMQVHEAWCAVERDTRPATPESAAQPEGTSSLEWKA